MGEEVLRELLNRECLFETERLAVINWKYMESQSVLEKTPEEYVIKILSPEVTRSLPDGWQNLDSAEEARGWIDEQKRESYFFGVSLKGKYEPIGFLFLYEGDKSNESHELRLGYLLSESVWGMGIGSELINGLVWWCEKTNVVSSISGGVERGNAASIKVLKKNGFKRSDEDLLEDMVLYRLDF